MKRFHVHVAVSDLEASVKFYSAIFAAAPAVLVKKDGPYLVTGVPDIKCDVAPADPMQYALCRCGASKTKPYCDGTHRATGFTDDRN